MTPKNESHFETLLILCFGIGCLIYVIIQLINLKQ